MKRENGKPQNYKLKMTFAVLILTALFVAELYVIINFPKNYLVLGILCLVMLCIVYRITDLSFQIQNEKQIRSDEEYERIFKSSKISYVFLRKSFEEMNKMLGQIEENCSTPVEELVEAQKAIAKVTINRSKENTNALMNSNENLIDRMFAFEKKLEELSQSLAKAKNQDEFRELNENIAGQQKKLMVELEELKTSLNTEIQKVSDSVESVQTTVIEQGESSREETMMSMDDIDQLLQQTTEMMESAAEEMPNPAEEAVPEEIPMPAEEVMPEEIPMPAEEVVPEEIPMPAEEVMPEETAMPAEEVMPEEIPMPTEEVMPEEIPAPVEEKPVSSDPNHIMTPEEIAALLGETNAAAPEPEPEPAAEEKPPMPDLSDPGHVMTPEEIAALLANM